MEKSVFTGGLKYHPNDTLYREIEPGQPQYVGRASPAIDKAWNDLLMREFIEGEQHQPYSFYSSGC